MLPVKLHISKIFFIFLIEFAFYLSTCYNYPCVFHIKMIFYLHPTNSFFLEMNYSHLFFKSHVQKLFSKEAIHFQASVLIYPIHTGAVIGAVRT